MFAGKTTEIQRIVRRQRVLGRPVLILTANIDTRYATEAIVNHDHVSEAAVAVGIDKLGDILGWRTFQNASAIVVDEAQFFRGCLYDFVHAAVDMHGKHVTVVGLDGDAHRKPFGDVLSLIPLADSVTKLTALCRRCGDGTAAIFTLRRPLPPLPAVEAVEPAEPADAITDNQEQVQVGGAEQYESVCRRHFTE